MSFVVPALVLISVLLPAAACCQPPAYLYQWGTVGGGEGQFRSPTGLTVDAGGDVYVADASNHRVQKFTGNGAYLMQWGTYGTGDGQFHDPYGVAVDGDGHVYVADMQNHRIQVFGSMTTPATSTTWGHLKMLYR